MVCIYCDGPLDVINSRPQKRQNQIWRRRRCTACGAVFTALEALDLSTAISVAKIPLDGLSDGRPQKHQKAADLEPFDRDQLFISLYESLRHRPGAQRDARALADTATAHIILKAKHGRTDRRTIRDIVLNTLQRFDQAAATHYAAFHP